MKYIDTRNGKEITEDEVGTLVEGRFTLNMFEEELNELNDTVEICGITFLQGTALRRLDPVAFRVGWSDETSFIESDIIDNGESHPEVGIEVREDEE